ncbi:MAG: hypothetical protein OSB09_08355 [Planctomycetota bacterium]|nr:hypothetical protein [Planctomycetota bacterium]
MRYALVNCSHTMGSTLLGVFIAILVVMLAFPTRGYLLADEVQLKNGHLLRGRVLSDNGKQIVLQVPEGKMWIRRSRISSILRLDPRRTLIEECQRRFERGSPGSAIPFLRREYQHSPHQDEVLPLYRKSLLGEVESLLDRGLLEPAIGLWNEYCSLPGSTPERIPLRSRVLDLETLLGHLESEIHNSLESDQPADAVAHIETLLVRFPSERWKWAETLIENKLELGQRLYLAGELARAAPLLIEVVVENPPLLNRTRSAIVHCATQGHGLTLDAAFELLPEDPTLQLAAAESASIHGLGLDPALQYHRVEDLGGEPNHPALLEEQLRQIARFELAGGVPIEIPFERRLAAVSERLWRRWDLPASPPAALEVEKHVDLETMRDTLGLPCGPAILITEKQYGRVISERLHLVSDAPFIDQDQLPRELFRLWMPRILGQPRDLPPWLEEGLCARSRGTLALQRDQLLLSRASALGTLPEISRLILMEVSIEDEQFRAACGSLVQMLIEDVPRILLPEFLDQLATNGLEQSLSIVTGTDTLHELQQRWIRRVNSGL